MDTRTKKQTGADKQADGVRIMSTRPIPSRWAVIAVSGISLACAASASAQLVPGDLTGITAFTDCAFTNSPIIPSWWAKPNTITLKGYTAKMDAKPFLSIPVYSVRDVLLEDCALDCGSRSPLEICDLRKNQTDPDGVFEAQPATLTINNCTVASAEAPILTAPRFGQKPSEKVLTINFEGNKAADGSSVKTIEKNLVHTAWKVVEPAAETPAEPVAEEAAAEE